MKTIGFPKSTMPNEKRVALLPQEVAKSKHPGRLFFEKGYASHLGIPDREYEKTGAKVFARKKLFGESAVLCMPKVWAEDAPFFSRGQTLFGWLYVSQTPWLEVEIINKGMSAIAFEKMYYKNGKHVFYANSRISGECGILQAIAYAGMPPSKLSKVAILGIGNVGKAASKMLRKLGARFEVFNSKNIGDFFKSLGSWEMIVNCTRYDFAKLGPLLKTEDIGKMKPGCLVVDLSSDGIEFSNPQSAMAPVKKVGHILVYNNEHIPSLWPMHASESISKALLPFINCMLEGKKSEILEKSTVAVNGIILNP